MHTAALLHGLRFVDSFFPSGGYAFSSGLEAAVQGGAVRDSKDLARYVEGYLRWGLGEREAVAAGLAHDSVAKRNFDLGLRADAELDSMHVSRESRLASRQTGRQVIRVSAQHCDNAVVREFAGRVDAQATPGHLAVALGMTLAACGWEKPHAIGALLYQTAVGFLSAAMKLLPVGQHETQSLLAGWTPLFEELARAASETTELRSWTPVHDVYAMRHAILPTRLFRS
jgi:urease accessory protein